VSGKGAVFGGGQVSKRRSSADIESADLSVNVALTGPSETTQASRRFSPSTQERQCRQHPLRPDHGTNRKSVAKESGSALINALGATHDKRRQAALA